MWAFELKKIVDGKFLYTDYVMLEVQQQSLDVSYFIDHSLSIEIARAIDRNITELFFAIM